MKIIHELARDSTRKNRRDAFAIRVSILMAVIMMGTLLFIFNELELGEWQYHKRTVGDYQATLIHVNEEEFHKLQNNSGIAKIGLSKIETIEETGLHRPDVQLYLQSAEMWSRIDAGLIKGQAPEKGSDIVVSETFMMENPDYDVGKELSLGYRSHHICGVYREHLMSFSSSYLMLGMLQNPSTVDLFQNATSVDVALWFKHERDTYPQIRKILQDFGKDEGELIKAGGLVYNTGYLEGKLIFARGLIPSRNFMDRWNLRIGMLLCMLALFAVMIYNAFNVWNNQDLRQIGLLKSSGMSQKQVRKLVVEKAIRLSLRPILWGLVLAYFCTNLLFFLMWLNHKNAHSLVNSMSAATDYGFRLVTPSPSVFIVLFLLSLFCVFVAALRPARCSSKLSIIDAMKNVDMRPQKLRLRSTRYTRNISRGLARDYSVSYRRTFRGLALAMALAGMAFSVVHLEQSWRGLSNEYNKPTSPYTLTADFFTIHEIPVTLSDEVREVPNVRSSHLYATTSYRFQMKGNEDFVSSELRDSLSHLKTERAYHPEVTVYGLEDDDYKGLLQELEISDIEKQGFLLLDRTADDPDKAYQFRTYLPLSNPKADHFTVRDRDDKEKTFELPIMGRIEAFPYDIRPLWPDQIALFTSLSKLEEMLVREGKVNEDNPLSYQLKVEAGMDELPEVTDEVEGVLYRYVPKSDTFISNRIRHMASEKEQSRNELLLSAGLQALFLVIGLSNAYNSFNANIKARTRDFALLRSAGMTEEQLKSMIHYEGFFLIRRVFAYYILLLAAGIFALTARRKFMFTPLQVFLNINFLYVILFFGVSILGIWLAIESGKRKVLRQKLLDALQQDS